MGKPLSIFDTCVKITSGFEGTDYGTVTGNFDGQGMSFGLLQWNLKQETFQRYILSQISPLAFDFFPVPIAPLVGCPGDEAVTWAKDVMLDANGKVKPDWEFAWKRFLTSMPVVNMQKRAIDKYFHQAKCIAGKMGFSQQHRRAMAWAFDVAVQNWDLEINPPAAHEDQAYTILSLYAPENFALWCKQDLTKEKQILVIASHLRALRVKPEWRSNVFHRKCTIAMGIGVVNRYTWKIETLLTN